MDSGRKMKRINEYMNRSLSQKKPVENTGDGYQVNDLVYTKVDGHKCHLLSIIREIRGDSYILQTYATKEIVVRTKQQIKRK